MELSRKKISKLLKGKKQSQKRYRKRPNHKKIKRSFRKKRHFNIRHKSVRRRRRAKQRGGVLPPADLEVDYEKYLGMLARYESAVKDVRKTPGQTAITTDRQIKKEIKDKLEPFLADAKKRLKPGFFAQLFDTSDAEAAEKAVTQFLTTIIEREISILAHSPELSVESLDESGSKRVWQNFTKLMKDWDKDKDPSMKKLAEEIQKTIDDNEGLGPGIDSALTRLQGEYIKKLMGAVGVFMSKAAHIKTLETVKVSAEQAAKDTEEFEASVTGVVEAMNKFAGFVRLYIGSQKSSGDQSSILGIQNAIIGSAPPETTPPTTPAAWRAKNENFRDMQMAQAKAILTKIQSDVQDTFQNVLGLVCGKGALVACSVTEKTSAQGVAKYSVENLKHGMAGLKDKITKKKEEPAPERQTGTITDATRRIVAAALRPRASLEKTHHHRPRPGRCRPRSRSVRHRHPTASIRHPHYRIWRYRPHRPRPGRCRPRSRSVRHRHPTASIRHPHNRTYRLYLFSPRRARTHRDWNRDDRTTHRTLRLRKQMRTLERRANSRCYRG